VSVAVVNRDVPDQAVITSVFTQNC